MENKIHNYNGMNIEKNKMNIESMNTKKYVSTNNNELVIIVFIIIFHIIIYYFKMG